MGVRERDFLLFVWIRLSGILRANQFKKLVGTPKLEPLLDAALRPSTGDDRLCGVEHAIVDAAHNRYFKMEGGIFLANFGGWQAIDALVGAIERGEELMLIVMRDVQLQAEAHAVAFERALPNSLGGKDGIGGLPCADSGRLAVKNQGEAHTALCPSAVYRSTISGEISFVGSTNGGHIEVQRGIFLDERCDFNAVDALIEAVDGGFEGAVRCF